MWAHDFHPALHLLLQPPAKNDPFKGHWARLWLRGEPEKVFALSPGPLLSLGTAPLFDGSDRGSDRSPQHQHLSPRATDL